LRAILFHREAKAELIGAIAYYDGQRDGFGQQLLLEVEQATERIAARPASFPSTSDRAHRKCVLKTFPYTIYFVEMDATIWIMAVAHHSRRPEYWRQREPE